MAAPCTDADIRRALGTVAVKCSDAALLQRLAQVAQQHGLTAKAVATRYSTFTINRRAIAIGSLACLFLEGLSLAFPPAALLP
jgi:hypothetical protein